MLKKFDRKKEYLLISVVVVLFIFVSYLSLTSINQLRGNARVINYVGIVRGATQRLIKKEMYSYPDDALITRLDSIVNELITGVGPNNLIVLQDKVYLGNMGKVRQSWTDIKMEIENVRQGRDKQNLFEMSEDYFILVDQTVTSAEVFSETQVRQSMNMLVGANAVFIVLILIGAFSFIRSTALKRRADALGKIAYIDPLTQMPNRAACEREIDTYTKNPPVEDIAAFMFDMNNLKTVNDQLGHQGGDRIIADFARIIKTEGLDFGFVGRYGGDEFMALFRNADEFVVENYLTRVNEKVIAYNLLHVNKIEKISFAVGYVIDNLKTFRVEDLINKADGKMYERKRQMKENKLENE